MPKHTTTLDDETKDVLSRSQITATTVSLPEQLARPLYEKVNKVLVAAGGKWNRGAKAHVFPRDPREALGLALETGGIINERTLRQQFFTPQGLAADLITAADIRPGMTVLEPSAGEGALALEARVAGGLVCCIEIDPALVEVLRGKGFLATCLYFLRFTPHPYELFDRVVMNPPFEKQQDIDHVLHALTFLKPGGKLAAVMSAGAEFSSTKKGRTFRAQIKALGGTFQKIAPGTFEESGTGVNTVMLVVSAAVRAVDAESELQEA